jgi:hypothetical protein
VLFLSLYPLLGLRQHDPRLLDARLYPPHGSELLPTLDVQLGVIRPADVVQFQS